MEMWEDCELFYEGEEDAEKKSVCSTPRSASSPSQPPVSPPAKRRKITCERPAYITDDVLRYLSTIKLDKESLCGHEYVECDHLFTALKLGLCEWCHKLDVLTACECYGHPAADGVPTRTWMCVDCRVSSDGSVCCQDCISECSHCERQLMPRIDDDMCKSCTLCEEYFHHEDYDDDSCYTQHMQSVHGVAPPPPPPQSSSRVYPNDGGL